MSLFVCDLPTLTIANAGTESNAIGGFDDAEALTLYAPATLTGTVTVEVEPTIGGSSFVDLTSAGSDVTIGAGNALVLSPITFRQLRLSSSLAEGAERSFSVTKQFRVR